MRDIQTIFNLIIDSGLYIGDDAFMCDSVDRAWVEGLITATEAEETRFSIREYIHGAFSLRGILKRNDLPCDYQYRRTIYRAWAARPVLKNVRMG